MKLDITVRQIIPSDRDGLAYFLVSNNIPEIVRNFHPFPLTFDVAQRIACQPHRDKYYIAIVKCQIVGLSMLRGWDEGFSIPSFGIIVDHRMHGRCIGKRLLEYTLDQASKFHCQRVRLTVFASNASAVHLYKGVGFYEVSRTSVVISNEVDEKIVMFKDFA